ncbi:TonB-dependent receptor [Compostibacter hankyongensis]|uniref:TonB-dependent receptor n=1 Tax=Compostibacter hankyongensis TaxID=1007089 RepID=A0ABP8G0W3_9BACT
MKLALTLMLTVCMKTSAAVYAQQTRITLSLKAATPEEAFAAIRQQSGYLLLYNNEKVGQLQKKISVQVENATIGEAMDKCLEGLPLSWRIMDNTIIITPRPSSPSTAEQPPAKAPPVTGTVSDSTGQPLVGVSVKIKDGSGGTVTDASGRFELEAPEDAVLVFSYIGYQLREVPVNGSRNLTVHLRAVSNTLDRLVVVGYGVQKKSSLTSAVSDIQGDALVKRPVSNAPQALQGLAPGVTVEDRGGAPGKANAAIRIRGVTTLGNNDPLVMVDGVEQSLQDINPNDIASVTVLKDAASTAIYGSRAANGVVLVTTKRASAGKLKVHYDGYYAIQRSIYHPKHMGLEDYLNLQNNASVNAGGDPKYTPQQIQDWVHATDRYKYPMPNVWFDYFLSPAPQNNNTLSLEGGNEQIRTIVTLNYFNQQGIIPQSSGDKKEVRVNTDLKVSKRISVSGDFNYRIKDYLSPLHESQAFRYMLSGSNFAVPRYPDGTYGLGSENYSPLVTDVLDGSSNAAGRYGFFNLKANIELLKGLHFQTQYAGRLESFTQKNFAKSYEIRDYYNKDNILKSVSPNSLTEIRNNESEYTLNNLLTYDAVWGKHTLNALLGYSQVAFKADTLSAYRNGFYNNDVQAISQGADDSRDNSGHDYSWGLRSYFGRLTYNYADRYFFEANARYDGSSRFTGKNKYSFFPSFSGAWRLSQESFWEGLAPVLSEFKLRGSWGKTGNQAVDLYSYYEALSAYNYNFGGNAAQGIIQTTLANQDLTWETNTQTDVGLDAALLRGKLGLTFDYYVKKTTGILLVLPIPGTVGLIAPPQNAGVVQNKGWELSLTYRDQLGALQYNLTANLSDIRNKILSLAGTGPYINGSPNEVLTIRKEGLPIDAYMGYKTLGYFTSQDEIDHYPVFDPGTKPGDLKYADVNGDNAINADDYVVLGSSIPRYTYSLNIGLTYKNFDANIFFQGVGKANALPSGALREEGNWGGFTLDMQKDYWTPENTHAAFPRPEANSIRNSQMSDFWMINAAYLKLKNLQIGYTLPASLTEKWHIQKARVYLSGSNLLTFSEATQYGLDPEFPSGRLDYYPQVSLYTAGINLDF